MDFKQLNAFLTVSELHNFTKAGESLGYAQSSITTQIRLFEDELGVKLFERMGKNVTLTHEGKKLLPYVMQLSKLSNDIKNVVSPAKAPAGSLTIGAAESLCSFRLPGILKQYRKLYPGVEISLKLLNCEDFKRCLSDNIIDVAFSLGTKINFEDFITVAELPEPVLLLAYPDHPFVTKEQIKPSDLENEALILTETGCSYRAKFEEILRNYQIKPKVALETGSVQAIKQFTMSGIGICVLPEIAVIEEISSGKLIPLHWTGPDFGIVSQVIYHKNKWISPALKEFIQLVGDVLKQK